ncbi:MAG: trehalose-phosphatase [Candidatus Tantalella remota]|nr:trehalose-phosphatase [Candidatus Tantalella remota]
MRHFLKVWAEEICPSINGPIYLFLDFDGTITPIQDHPDNVFLDDVVKGLIKDLADKSGVSVAIISGRELSDLEARVGIKNVVYAGNHGLEIKGPFGRRKLGEAMSAIKVIEEVKIVLDEALAGTDKVYIEDKGLTLSVHFRMVEEKLQGKVEADFATAIDPFLLSKKVRVTRGKKVLEVRPPIDWHKGKIVRYLLEREKKRGVKIIPIYIGDDVTDEDAFPEINAVSGYSIKIVSDSKVKSNAEYYLKNTDEVRVLLSELYITQRLKGGDNNV